MDLELISDGVGTERLVLLPVMEVALREREKALIERSLRWTPGVWFSRQMTHRDERTIHCFSCIPQISVHSVFVTFQF